MPRHPLTRGTYWVTVTTTARTVSWSFTVDPDVADVPLTPAANTYVTGPRSGFAPSTPTRLADSRMGVPGNATAISANFTALRATEAGYVSLFPCGADVPVVSTVNFNAGQIVPNAAIVSLAGNGTFCAYASTPVDLVVDVNGAFAPEATGGAVFVTPQRVFDTRTGHRAHERLGDQGVLTVRLSGAGTGVPADATAVVLNVTAYRPTAATYVTAWPTGQPRPIASNLNMSAGEHRANLVIVPLGTDGRVSFYTEASTDLFGDLVAYISDAPGAQRFTPLSPTRMADTREARQTLLNAGTHGAPLAGGTALQVAMRATRGIPDDATAVALNITTVGATAEGFVTVYPCTAQVPFASTVNPLPGQVVPNAAVAQLSPGGSVCVYASHTTHVVIDVVGYWS